MAKSSVASQLAERLTKIIVMLNNGVHLDLKSLADEFGVSKRTLDRDVERLSSCLPLQQNSRTADSSGKCNSIKTSHNFTRCIPT